MNGSTRYKKGGTDLKRGIAGGPAIGAATDLIIFSGQSNMQGQSEKLLTPRSVKGALEYRQLTDELVPLKDPAGEDIGYDGRPGYAYEDWMGDSWHKGNALGSAAYGHSTLLPAFAAAYTVNSGRNIVAVHAAKGSTDLGYWLPGASGYKALTDKALMARDSMVRAGIVPGHVFLVWLQGESDAIIGKSKGQYKDELAAIDSALRSTIGLDRFCLIRVGRFTCDERDKEIMDAQDEICRENSRFMMLTDIAASLYYDPPSMNPFVGGHFSALGLARIGTDAGTKLANALSHAKNDVDLVSAKW
jgi:hypothetical protein